MRAWLYIKLYIQNEGNGLPLLELVAERETGLPRPVPCKLDNGLVTLVIQTYSTDLSTMYYNVYVVVPSLKN